MLRTLFLLFLIHLGMLCCGQKKLPKGYINNDSTSIYSTHASRPFRYGYAYKSREECDYFFRDLRKNFNIQPGETVADVGAASGWIEGVLSVFTDSVTYYVQDIDSIFGNASQLEKVVAHYTKLRGTPQTNTFRFVLGTATESRLPDALFDKIIVNNALHEIKQVDKMLDDLKRKLKPGGLLIISDGFSNGFKKHVMKGCKIKAPLPADVIAEFKQHGFFLINASAPFNSLYNCLTFQLYSAESGALQTRVKTTEALTLLLDELNKPEVANDSLQTKEICAKLRPHLTELKNVYPSLENYLSALGSSWLTDKKYTAALNVYNAELTLYPESPYAFNNLGDVYAATKDYPKALACYKRSATLHPGNTEARRNIINTERLMAK